MSLINRLSHSFKKKIILPAAILASSFLQAQTPPDTTYGQGNLEFLHNGNPIENVQTRMKAVTMTDSVIPTEYFGLSDANGFVPFDVPTSIDYHINLPENATLQDANVFPIPGNEANIILPNYDNYNLNLFDLSGKRLKHEEFNGTNHLYTSLADLPTGPYILQVTNDNGEVVHRTKTIKVAGAVNGPHYINPAQLSFGKTDNFAKVQANATYRLWFNPPQGYVSDSTDISISDGMNGNIPIQLVGLDTLLANAGTIISFDAGAMPNVVQNTPVTIETINMQDFLIPNVEQVTTSTIGSATYSPRPVHVGVPGSTGTAQVEFSWPEIINPAIDSNSVNVSHEGWYAGSQTETLGPGTNPNIHLMLNRKPTDSRIGKAKVRFELGKFDKYFTRTNTDSALIIIENLTQNSTDSIWTDSLGNATSDWYNHQDDLRIGAGYPGGVDANGNPLKAYTNIDVLIDGMTYFDIANQDSISETIQANLLPDSVYIQGIDTTVYLSAPHLTEMHLRTAMHKAKFNIINYNIDNPSDFTIAQITNIRTVLDSVSTILPYNIVELQTNIPNSTPYNSQTATATSHGITINQGSNNTTRILTPSTIKGETTTQVGGIIYVTGATSGVLKEVLVQSTGAAGVTSRPISIASGFSTTNYPTTIDYAILTTKHFTEKEMFNQTQTQNISISYVSDSNNIQP